MTARPDGPNRRWLVIRPPRGQSIDGCLKLETGSVPSPGPGQMLLRNLWLSIDPTYVLTLSDYASQATGSAGTTGGVAMRGLAVSQVVASHLPDFQAGDLVHGISGWEDYSVADGQGFYSTWKVPPGATPAQALGVLGATGLAAYFGMTDVGRPAAGEMVVVSGAAGGVGSIAAQIARIRGARVIGIAGGAAKCAWLTGEARLHGAIDHRTEDVGARLDTLCPEGIDVFFDNVGGPVLDLALERLRTGGRVVVCGATARYGADPRPPGPSNYLALTMAKGRMEGVLAKAYADQYPRAMRELRGWLDADELRPLNDVMEGLEHAPAALARLFRGENVGKQLVRIADPPA